MLWTQTLQYLPLYSLSNLLVRETETLSFVQSVIVQLLVLKHTIQYTVIVSKVYTAKTLEAKEENDGMTDR